MKAVEEGKCEAFTILELLAVIVIIVLMAVLLSPAIGKLLAKSRQMQCAANQRQLTAAFQQYISENNGSFFLDRDWYGLLDPYLNRENVSWWSLATFRGSSITCPAVNALSPRRFNSGIYGVNYSFINTIEGSVVGLPPASWPIRIVNVPNMHKAWVFTEAGWCSANGSHDRDPVGFITPGTLERKPGSGIESLTWPHNEKRKSFAFLDGHVELMSWEEVNAFNGAPSNSKEFNEFNGLRYP